MMPLHQASGAASPEKNLVPSAPSREESCQFLMHHLGPESDQMELVCKGKVETLYLLKLILQTDPYSIGYQAVAKLMHCLVSNTFIWSEMVQPEKNLVMDR
jgi:hypothetical protein